MLNLKKCEGMWIGVDKDRQENGNLFGIKWPSSIKYLGVYLGHNKEANLKSNWDEKMNILSKL